MKKELLYSKRFSYHESSSKSNEWHSSAEKESVPNPKKVQQGKTIIAKTKYFAEQYEIDTDIYIVGGRIAAYFYFRINFLSGSGLQDFLKIAALYEDMRIYNYTQGQYDTVIEFFYQFFE